MLYEFKCKQCGNEFEENRRLIENSNKAECPKCKGESEKIMSKFGFKVMGFSSLNGYSHANR